MSPDTRIDKIKHIQWKETYISCFTFILPGLKESEVCDNYFALERLQKQSLWQRKTRQKKNFGEEKLSVSTFLSSPRVLLFRRVLLRNSFQQLLSCRKNPKEICPTWSFLMNVLKGNHQHCLRGVFIQNGGKSISVVCDDDSSVGKVLSKTNLLVN